MNDSTDQTTKSHSISRVKFLLLMLSVFVVLIVVVLVYGSVVIKNLKIFLTHDAPQYKETKSNEQTQPCEAIKNFTFESIDKFWGHVSPYISPKPTEPSETFYVTFGENTYNYFEIDMFVQGVYACDDGKIRAFDRKGNISYEGIYNTNGDILTWNSHNYRKYEKIPLCSDSEFSLQNQSEKYANPLAQNEYIRGVIKYTDFQILSNAENFYMEEYISTATDSCDRDPTISNAINQGKIDYETEYDNFNNFNTLYEVYCDFNNEVQSRYYDCPYGCKDGACIMPK